MGEKVCQFKGFMQQDAQEFMAFLLDGLHEVQITLIYTLVKRNFFFLEDLVGIQTQSCSCS